MYRKLEEEYHALVGRKGEKQPADLGHLEQIQDCMLASRIANCLRVNVSRTLQRIVQEQLNGGHIGGM